MICFEKIYWNIETVWNFHYGLKGFSTGKLLNPIKNNIIWKPEDPVDKMAKLCVSVWVELYSNCRSYALSKDLCSIIQFQKTKRFWASILPDNSFGNIEPWWTTHRSCLNTTCLPLQVKPDEVLSRLRCTQKPLAIAGFELHTNELVSENVIKTFSLASATNLPINLSNPFRNMHSNAPAQHVN